ncbi:hypothetical protein ACHAXR_002385 [Thalassiosira sp. AJA248-18]
MAMLLHPSATVLGLLPAVAHLHHVAAFVIYPPCRVRANHRSNCRVALHATTTASSSWRSCAQPRFDEFASCTVGPWITAPSQSSSAENVSPIQEEIEEVMRSCGGAIQGIRELPLSLIFPAEEDASFEERTYHNRADGGFVYADDGSYSAGPEQWDWNEAVTNEKQLFMASLAFTGKRRMWLTSKLSESSEIVKCGADMHYLNPRNLELSRPVSTQENSNDENDESKTVDLDSAQLPNINWEVMQRVRMPNSNQAWSLARAKWEKQIIESDKVDEADEADDATSINNEKMGPLIGWAYIESISGDQVNNMFGDVVDADAINVHMLAVCPASEVARSVVRCYDVSGLLKSVAFLHGSLSNTDDQL